MRIAIGSDHAGYDLKAHLVAMLRSLDHTVVDVGCEQAEAEARLQPAQELEQHHRVRPAGERAAHPAARADAGRGEDRGGGFGQRIDG